MLGCSHSNQETESDHSTDHQRSHAEHLIQVRIIFLASAIQKLALGFFRLSGFKSYAWPVKISLNLLNLSQT